MRRPCAIFMRAGRRSSLTKMIHKTIQQHMAPAYVCGTHEEFKAALGDAVGEVITGAPEGALCEVVQISHSVAAEGDKLHWSAVALVRVTFEYDDADEDENPGGGPESIDFGLE